MSREQRKRPVRILFVDDDEDDFVLLRDAIRSIDPERLELEWVDQVDKALEIMSTGAHDLWLFDYRLGAWTGLELVEEARRRGWRVPAILLTGSADAEVDDRAMEAGVFDFLVKAQVTPVLLDRAIRYTLQRSRMVEALRRSEASFREVIERLPDAITVWRGERLIYANPAVLALIGAASADELVGKKARELEHFIHPEDRVILRPVKEEARGGSRAMREMRFLRRAGETVTVEIAHFRVSFDGQPCAMWIAHDLTERKQMQARLLLSDRMVSLGTLAAGIGHEINNPLAYVIANLTHLERELLPSLPLEERQREELRSLVAETQHGALRIREITQQLKLFSQVERETTSSRVNVEQVIESSVRMVWNEIRHRARLVRQYGEALVVEAPEGRLGQVFLNLLVNAAHAIPEGSVEQHEIRVVTRRQGELAIVEIHDTGVGIPEEHRERVFEPFFTTRPGGGGTGLGLSVCLGIVTGLNGRMEVESTVGQGSVFRVILPIAPTEAPVAQPPAPPEVPAARRGRILSVDDEPMIGAAITRALRQEHDVLALASAREAQARILRGERFDVILCDLMMPEMSGMELYEEIQRAAPEQAERMVFLTGGAFTPRARAFLSQVKNRCMEKPFTPAELRELLRSMVR
jgi:PAS domain S-box-containing protein